jgi:hypothetical protein
MPEWGFNLPPHGNGATAQSGLAMGSRQLFLSASFSNARSRLQTHSGWLIFKYAKPAR